LLAAASVLGGTLFYLKSIDTHGHRRWIWLVLMAVCMAAGVLSKESAVVLIGILPLYDSAYRMSSRGILSTKSLEAFWRFFWKGYIVLVPIVVALFAIRYSMQLSHGPAMMAWKDNPMRGTDFLSARFTAVKVIGYYLGLLVFPLKLSCDYTLDAIPNSSWRMSSLEDWKAALAFSLLAALAVVVWFCHRRGGKSVFFLAGWFFIALLPTANVLFLIDSNMAERFLYLPLFAYAGLFALTLNAISQQIHRTGYVVLLGLVISLLGCRTYLRNQDWRSNLTLWTSASKVSPASFRVQRSLAIAMYDQKSEPFDLDEIIDVARKATAITRKLPVEQGDQLSHFFLGMLYGQKADRAATRDLNGSVILTDEVRTIFDQALSELETAASIGETIESKKSASMRSAKKNNQDLPAGGPVQVYETLFMVYSRLGRHGDAVKTLRKIQAINPLASRVYRFLPDELILSGNSSEAGVVLIQAFLLHVEHEFAAQQLTSIYAPGNQATQPIVLRDGATLSFDLTNPLLRTDVDAAFAQLIELFLRKKNFVAAEQLMEASASFQCDPAPLNALYKRLGVKR
jgi:tetratricopeptide (TPR) repeat protein